MSNTNSMLINVGKIVQHSQQFNNFDNDGRLKLFNDGNKNVQEEIVLLKKGIESTITEEEQNGPTIPMVVFVLDVSGSMGTTTTVTSSDGMMVPTGYDKEVSCTFGN